jgi:hypothetical protein
MWRILTLTAQPNYNPTMRSQTLTRSAMHLALASLGYAMQGVVYEGQPYQVVVKELALPTIQEPTDVIVKMRMSAVCGTDLHMYHGKMGSNSSWGMGHEGLGVVYQVGSAVKSLKPDDFVVIPDNIGSGHLDLGTPTVNVFGVGRTLDGLQGKHYTPPATTGRSSSVLTIDSGICAGTPGRAEPYSSSPNVCDNQSIN